SPEGDRSANRDSNARPSAWQADALAAQLFPLLPCKASGLAMLGRSRRLRSAALSLCLLPHFLTVQGLRPCDARTEPASSERGLIPMLVAPFFDRARPPALRC